MFSPDTSQLLDLVLQNNKLVRVPSDNKKYIYDIRPRVYKETENQDQDQDQTYKLQLLDRKSCKFDEIFTILSGGLIKGY